MDPLINPVRRYCWGSREVIAGMQGRPVPSPSPEAELWVGAHPSAPSRLAGSSAALTELIAADPVRLLSSPVVGRFGARLPYLLKLLAAASPLSLQAHPDAERAAAGYAEEEAAGVSLDARERRYVDPYHKPELLVAVTGFRALCGFRAPEGSAGLLTRLGVPGLAPVAAALRSADLAAAVRAVLAAPDPAGLIAEVAVAAAGDRELALVAELADGYPDDRGVLLGLLLNQVDLAPTEAIFIPAGSPHAYLSGAGVEIMAASDNVLRGGFTSKHVDVPELLRVLRYEPLREPVLRPVPVAAGVWTWPVPVAEFALHRVRPADGDGRVELVIAGPRVVLCVAGEVTVAAGAGPAVTLGSGEAGFAAAAEDARLVLTGPGEAYLASVGGSARARKLSREALTSPQQGVAY